MLPLLQLENWPHGNHVAVSVIEGNACREITYDELRGRALALSDYLIEQGVDYKDRIAILSESSPEWVVALFAAARAGATAVPLDPKLSASEVEEVLRDAEPRLVFASSRCVETVLRIEASCPEIRHPILLNRPRQQSSLPSIVDLQAAQSHEGRERTLDETALIVYTSGTTARPKGVMITFRNLVFEIGSLLARLPVDETDVFYSMLPFNHLLEFTGGLCSVMYAGAEVCLGPSLLPAEILKIIAQKKVTKMVTVPLFLRLFKRELEKTEEKDGAQAVHARLGGNFKYFISGGAPLDPEVERFYHRIGIPVYQGYGLTECSPVIAANSPAAHRLGSVGRPLEGTELRIEMIEDGSHEIQTRGPHVMRGYFRKDDLTREAVDAEGWLRTGDLGRLDEDGFLYVTGRLKNLIVLGNGKKVQPEEVEAALSQSSLVREVCILGAKAADGLLAGTEEVCVVAVASEECRLRFESQPALMQDAIRSEIESLAMSLAPFKRPSRLAIYPEPFPRSVSNKIKRALVCRWLDEHREAFS
jgi:long-chain acyl-CoA synthetase